jgi:hypothetical protein
MTMTNRTKSSPYQNLEEIALRKAQLRKQIAKQESRLSRDFDAYQDDVDTLKRLWNRVVSIATLRKRTVPDNVSSRLSKISALSNKPGLVTALSVGAKVVSWLWKRKHKR